MPFRTIPEPRDPFCDHERRSWVAGRMSPTESNVYAVEHAHWAGFAWFDASTKTWLTGARTVSVARAFAEDFKKRYLVDPSEALMACASPYRRKNRWAPAT